LAESVLADPQQSIGHLDVLSAAELQQLLIEFNDTTRPLPANKTLIDLFEELAEKVPDATAVCAGDRQLSYRELNQRANQLGLHLQQTGVGPEVPVGVFLERSVELIVALVGILKAGGVYVPLDPANPIERLDGILGDSQVTMIVTQRSLVDRLPVTPPGHVFCVDEEFEQISSRPNDNLPRQASSENAAYVIYTSGSTGKPKGTVLLHRGLVNIRQEQGRLFQPLVGDRVLQFAAIGFDASIFEMVMALGSGATLCLGTRDQLLPGTALLQFLADQKISVVTLPPSGLAAMKEAELPHLRVITVAGEVCPADVVNRWAKGRCFFNLYGPTETTIWATYVRCEPDGQVPTIGKPIANTRVYLVDRQLQPVPLGIPGELCIAGVGLAREYLRRPELTAEQFVANPFGTGRLYRTGDLAQYLPNGTLQFLGRIDHQVKVRGYRIELGEIEAVLRQHRQIRDVVVSAREDETGTTRLVAYVVQSNPSDQFNQAILRDDLRRKLPEYMVPAVFVVMDEFPLTPNNKVDRRRLPAPDRSRTDSKTHIAPRDDLEHVLVHFLQEVLRVEGIGVNDSFFDLGGDSLLATQIVSRVRESFHLELSISQIFTAVDAAAMAVLVRGAIPEGHADKIARTIRRLAEMSDEEKHALLEQRRPTAL
jgi:amino acid adenylation domain-containing protein